MKLSESTVHYFKRKYLKSNLKAQKYSEFQNSII